MGAPAPTSERPAKRAKLLDESDSEESDGGVGLKINEEYAKRFEHNKKREERQRLEEKYGKSKTNMKDEASEEDSDESSSYETEDDEGMLATEDLDAQINATLQAIRSKDPRIRQKDFTFYSKFNPEQSANTKKEEKPMTLKDYHRKNLLEGIVQVQEDEDAPPRTYAQEQEDIKNDILKTLHGATAEESDSEDDEGDFLVAKNKPEVSEPSGPVRAETKITLDVENAEKDPETFLSNFMAARAWLPTDGSRFQPFESDDEEEEVRAEAFEEAYNLRFEDPERANETLRLHARDAAAKYSVRREERSSRKKQREAVREKKEAEKRERDEEKARLRKLKIEEMEERVQKIREAAGLRGQDVDLTEWAAVLDADFDDGKWEEVMKKRFGDNYYEDEDGGASSDEESDKKKRKPKKPKWDDDIDIKDLVPDFSDGDKNAKPAFRLSDNDEGEALQPDPEAMDVDAESSANAEATSKKKKHDKKAREQAKADAKRAARKERRLIETLVDQNLDLSVDLLSSSKKNPTRFRYRETSPNTYGLTPRDILMADDSALNQFAGLKKLAAFRDPERKKKDKKKLGKKARLREWRKETFGNEEGPDTEWSEYLSGRVGGNGFKEAQPEKGDDSVDIREGKKKKRSRKRKAQATQ